MHVEGHAPVVGEGDSLAAEALLHHVWRLEVPLPGKHAVPVHDAMTGEIGTSRFIERPPHRSCRAPPPQMCGDVAVGGDAPGRNLGNDPIDAIEE